jgi:hypothetical protein
MIFLDLTHINGRKPLNFSYNWHKIIFYFHFLKLNILKFDVNEQNLLDIIILQ